MVSLIVPFFSHHQSQPKDAFKIENYDFGCFFFSRIMLLDAFLTELCLWVLFFSRGMLSDPFFFSRIMLLDAFSFQLCFWMLKMLFKSGEILFSGITEHVTYFQYSYSYCMILLCFRCFWLALIIKLLLVTIQNFNLAREDSLLC